MRGGARPGAGRKPRPYKPSAITIRVEPEVAAEFKRQAEERGRSQAAHFAAMVEQEPKQ